MTFYSQTFHKSTRDEFARAAALDAFERNERGTLDSPSFLDRAPDDGPRPIGEVAFEVVPDAGELALHHWLAQADKAGNQDDREDALEITRNIARAADEAVREIVEADEADEE